MVTFSINVAGNVQGVWYRQSTKEKAGELGITGIVRNQPDGTVLIIATGTREQLEQLASWCKQGPTKASVTNIDVKELPLQPFSKFSVERSG